MYDYTYCRMYNPLRASRIHPDCGAYDYMYCHIR